MATKKTQENTAPWNVNRLTIRDVSLLQVAAAKPGEWCDFDTFATGATPDYRLAKAARMVKGFQMWPAMSVKVFGKAKAPRMQFRTTRGRTCLEIRLDAPVEPGFAIVKGLDGRFRAVEGESLTLRDAKAG